MFFLDILACITSFPFSCQTSWKEQQLTVQIYSAYHSTCEVSLPRIPPPPCNTPSPHPISPKNPWPPPSQPLDPPPALYFKMWLQYNSEKWSKNIKLALPILVLALLGWHKIVDLETSTPPPPPSPSKLIHDLDQILRLHNCSMRQSCRWSLPSLHP